MRDGLDGVAALTSVTFQIRWVLMEPVGAKVDGVDIGVGREVLEDHRHISHSVEHVDARLVLREFLTGESGQWLHEFLYHVVRWAVGVLGVIPSGG